MFFVNYKEKNFCFAEIFRVIVSGSSGVGKTSFIKQLLQAKLFKFTHISYHHPDAGESLPVDWHQSPSSSSKKKHNNHHHGLEKALNVVYKVGLPDEEYCKSLPEYSVIIIDDLYEAAVKSDVINYLVRVLSSKRKLHVCILTQQYFARGTYSVSIRNSCNYHCLMPSNDYGSNKLVARQFNLKQEFEKAQEYNSDELYPYIFIARDNIARRSQVQLFVNIFMRFKIMIIGCTVFYLISKLDFDTMMKIKDNQVAHLNDDNDDDNNSDGTNEKPETTINSPITTAPGSPTNDTTTTTTTTTTTHKEDSGSARGGESITSASTTTTAATSDSASARSSANEGKKYTLKRLSPDDDDNNIDKRTTKERRRQRRRIETQVNSALRRYQKRTSAQL